MINKAKELHEIDVYWLDPKEHHAIIQACGNDTIIQNRTKNYFAYHMNQLAKANEKAYTDIANKMVQFKTAEYKNEFISKYSQSCVNNKQRNRE